MILKFFELNKINLKKNRLILLYGKNEGLKKESINIILKDYDEKSNYDEKEVLDHFDTFLEDISSRSLFEKEKIIVIKRATEKISRILDEIKTKNFDDIIIIETGTLDKKSKLRSYFEKHKEHVCIAFYPDNEQTLSKITLDYLRKKNLTISQSNINLIVNKSSGDRENLINQLKKIELFCLKGKKITSENISKLINLSEDHSINELVDFCLSKNEKKTTLILNENNFNNEDCILITRIFLNKAKRILKLAIELEKNKNIELTISSAKPPIFWKDKEITKKQLYTWKPEKIRKLIYRLTEIELLIKKNINNPLNIITDFLLEQSSIKTNN